MSVSKKIGVRLLASQILLLGFSSQVQAAEPQEIELKSSGLGAIDLSAVASVTPEAQVAQAQISQTQGDRVLLEPQALGQNNSVQNDQARGVNVQNKQLQTNQTPERSFATNSLEEGHDEKPAVPQQSSHDLVMPSGSTISPTSNGVVSNGFSSKTSWLNRPWIEVQAPNVTHPRLSFGHDLLEDVKDSKWEALGVFGGITALGAKSWKWGSSGFHFQSEGFWGDESSSGATDKFGHAFSSYALTNIFAERLKAKGRSNDRAALNAFLLTEAMMLYVETFDGFSTDHGFSYEDVIANNVGAGIAYLRQRNPKIHDLIDYRMEYRQSDYKPYRPLSDYAGQKYFLAVKLGGVEALRTTPFKYVDLLGGYYARGYTDGERADQLEKKRVAFVGVGVDLSQVFFGKRGQDDANWKRVGRFASEHIQIPNTYTGIKNSF